MVSGVGTVISRECRISEIGRSHGDLVVGKAHSLAYTPVASRRRGWRVRRRSVLFSINLDAVLRKEPPNKNVSPQGGLFLNASVAAILQQPISRFHLV